MARKAETRRPAIFRAEARVAFPLCCLQAEVGYLLSWLDPADTGVDGVIWFSAGEFMRHPSPHGPRFLVVPGERLRRNGLKRAVQVRLASPHEVLGTLPGKLAQQVVRFAERNQRALLGYWHGETDTSEVLDLLGRV
jgi:hypothetical protein